MIRQILAAKFYDPGVNFHHGNLLNILVAADFSQHCAIATADDQHFLLARGPAKERVIISW